MGLNYQQKQKFKTTPEQVVQEFNFDGGWVADIHETKLKPNQSPDMENVVFERTKNIKTRNGYTRVNGDPIGSSSDEANTGASTATVSLASPGDYAGQTFQVGTIASIVQVDFYLAMNTANEEQYVQAQLWSGGTGPSTLVAKGQILLVSGTAETEYSFRFREPEALAATTEYAVVVVPFVRGSSNTINTVKVHRTGAAYGSGEAYTSTNYGVTWSAIGTADLKFNVYTGATANTGNIRFYNETGLKQTIAKYGSTLYRIDDTTGTPTAITLPTGVTLESSTYLDHTVVYNTLLIADGTNRIKKYRGSTNANYTTGTISVTNGSATVTGSGTTWSTSTNAEVNEYIQLPDSKWYRITAIGTATSLTIERTYQGSTLSGQTYVISPWGEIQGRMDSTAVSSLIRPLATYIENHIDRVWTAEGNTLRFSTVFGTSTEEHFNDFDTSSNAGAIIIPGDAITGLYSLNNGLYVFQRRAIWRVYGNSPGNFELRNVSNEIGMINKRSLVEYNDIVLFLSDAGIIMFDGSDFKNASEDIVNSEIENWANKNSCAATLWDNKYMIAYTPAGQTYNSEIMYLNLENNTFGKFTGICASSFSAWKGGTDDGRILFGSSNQGSIYRWDVGGNDDGYTIRTLHETPSLGLEAGINDKSIKKYYIQQLALGDWNMTVKQLLNISESEITGTAINLTNGSTSLWGVAQWGVDYWSTSDNIVTTAIYEFQGLAKYFKFRIEQEGYDEGVEVIGMVLTAKPRRLR